MAANEIKVGVQALSAGSLTTARAANDGSAIVMDAHARYQEAVYRGNVYRIAQQTGTTTQAGLSATTPALTLFNPKGNNKNAVLLYAGCINSVAFAAAAAIWLAVNNNIAAAAVTGTATAPVNALVGNANQPSCLALLAATLPAAPVAIASLGVGLTGAITTIPVIATLGRFFDGEIILAPGSAISFQTSTASGASGFFGEFAWEEIPV